MSTEQTQGTDATEITPVDSEEGHRRFPRQGDPDLDFATQKNEAARFFAAFGAAKVSLSALTPRRDNPYAMKRVSQRSLNYFGEHTELAHWCVETNASNGSGLYVSPNVHCDARDADNGELKKADIAFVQHFQLDIDPDVGKGGEFEGRYYAAKDHLHTVVVPKLLALACPPTIIINTGNGISAFWNTAEAYEIPPGGQTREDAIARFEGINAKLIKLFSGDRACKDITHLMRCPGSFNHPTQKKLEKGYPGVSWYSYMLHCDPSQGYTVEQMEDMLSGVEVVYEPRTYDEAAGGAGGARGGAGGVDPDSPLDMSPLTQEEAVEVERRYSEAKAQDPKLQKLASGNIEDVLREEDGSVIDTSNSSYRFHFAERIRKWGFEEKEYYHLMTCIESHVLEGREGGIDWVRINRQLAREWNKQSPEIGAPSLLQTRERLVEGMAAAGPAPVTPEMVARERVVQEAAEVAHFAVLAAEQEDADRIAAQVKAKGEMEQFVEELKKAPEGREQDMLQALLVRMARSEILARDVTTILNSIFEIESLYIKKRVDLDADYKTEKDAWKKIQRINAQVRKSQEKSGEKTYDDSDNGDEYKAKNDTVVARLDVVLRTTFPELLGVRTLLLCQEVWYQYYQDTGLWEQTEEAVVKQQLYHCFKKMYTIAKPTDGGPAKKEYVNLTGPTVSDVRLRLEDHSVLPGELDSYRWLGSPAEAPDMSETLIVKNGMLNVRTLDLTPNTPLLLTVKRTTAPWVPDSRCPEWDRFTRDIFTHDDGAVDTEQLQLYKEILGCCVMGDVSYQKAFIITGPTRSGKGATIKILNALLADDTGGLSISDFGKDFGLETAKGKRLFIVADARNSQTADLQLAAERILNLTGGDKMNINVKSHHHVNSVCRANLLICSNLTPTFSDDSGVLANRFIFVSTLQSFLGREDRTLAERVIANELSGVLAWCVDGYRSLRRRGSFYETAHSIEERAEMTRATAPVADWFDENVTTCPVGEPFGIKEFYSNYVQWCMDEHKEPFSISRWGIAFNAKLRSKKVSAVKSRMQAVTPGGRRAWGYKGVQLKVWGNPGVPPAIDGKGSVVPMNRG
jgi:putative DNA primase/helicase